MNERIVIVAISMMICGGHVVNGMEEEKYDNVKIYDSLAAETAQQWGLQEYVPKKDDNKRPLDSAKQLKIAKYYLYKQGNIEKIKHFHEINRVGYDDPYQLSLRGESFNPDKGVFPIDWALCKNRVDFALWLIEEKHVHVASLSPEKRSKIHYFASGIVGKECEFNHARLMNILLKNKALINALDSGNCTPLRIYTDNTDYKVGYNLEILKLFFDHGASLVVKQNGKDNVEVCNLISRELKYCQKMDIKYPVLGIAKFFKSRLAAYPPFLGLDYRNQLSYAKEKYDTYFIELSLWGKKSSKKGNFFKLPKPIMHAICKMASVYDENMQDIKASLSDKMVQRYVEYKPVQIDSRKKIFIEKVSVYSVTLLEYAQKSNQLKQIPLLLEILDLNLWNTSPATCYDALEKLSSSSI